MELGSKNKIIVILGPTASGKSEVAIKLAKKLNGEIISADSRQIYKKMDIGTGKIHGTYGIKHKTFTSEKIPHYIIDIISPKTDYNVANFKKDAEIIIKDILKRGKLPIICGGTGFWIKAIVDNVNFPEVKPNKKLRRKLEQKNTETLFKMLQKLDPERAKDIDAKNKVRLIRAIEIAKALGHVPKINTKYDIQNTKYQFLQIGIDISKEELHKKIKKRLEKRFKQGMIEEVKKLHSQGLSWKKIQSFGLGYYWIPMYLQGKLDKKELFEKVYQAEKDYAKRQMTWFKKDKRINWLKSYNEIGKEIKKFIL
ncbi:MAG: tRNA (adenosine(37)-N6)-dimethylallyltransferase MiaA [Patescibacteria group bacterium]